MSEVIENISTKAIAKIAIPIIISSLSFNLMIIVNRSFLAHYDLLAMNAIATVGLMIANLQFPFIGISSMSEVVAGRLNGAKNYKEVASPVWQMIWFGCFSSIFLIPIGIFGGKYVVSESYLKDGLPFFKILMTTIFLSVICHAINGFFVAIGKTKIITISTLAGNLLNIILDYILIFGIEGYIPELGAKGAAIATSCSMVLQLVIVSSVFFSDKNNKKYNTRNFKLHFEHFKECFKIGYPNSISHFIEFSAWSMIFIILTAVGQEYVAVHAINISIYLLFACINDGIQKAVISLVSNLVGANRKGEIDFVVKKAIYLLLSCTSVSIVIFAFFSRDIIQFVFNIDANSIIDLDDAVGGIKWVLLCLAVDGVSWIICAVLMGLGDTKFMMYTNGPLAWVIVVFPLFIFAKLNLIGLYTSWKLVCVYPIVFAIIGRWRYKAHLAKIV